MMMMMQGECWRPGLSCSACRRASSSEALLCAAALNYFADMSSNSGLGLVFLELHLLARVARQ
jgi:hypothetical protein